MMKEKQRMAEEYISPQTLSSQSGTAQAPTVIDVRSDEEYAAGHVRGALHIPLDELDEHLAEIPRDHPVVTYCNMRHRGDSRGERAAELLREQGYEATALEGGYPAWEAGNYPVEKATA
jgi:rhodanese-related sulfurtransferase